MTNEISTLTQERLKQLFEYNKHSGEFINVGNSSRKVGNNASGYLKIKVDGKTYFAHRLAFLYIDGVLPDSNYDVIHVDHDRFNNSFENLELVERKRTKQESKLTREDLLNNFTYKDGHLFKDGKIFGSSINKRLKYKACKINGKSYMISRLIFWMFNPEFGFFDKKSRVDHINGNIEDNSIENLRLTTNGQNISNSKRKKIVWRKRNKYYFDIYKNNVKKRFGPYNSEEDAIKDHKVQHLKIHQDYSFFSRPDVQQLNIQTQDSSSS
jgi:hypothetical protein